jgi:hypothetical protein
MNLSAQRCLTSFLLGNLFLEPCISLIYAWKTNKCNNYSFSLLIIYGILTRFGTTLLSSGCVPSAFWEMLNPQYSLDCSSIEHLSEGTRNAPWGWQCNAETCKS